MSKIKKIFWKYMLSKDILNFKQLSEATGIKYDTLLNHLERPELFRAYEIQAINEVLGFSSEDLIELLLQLNIGGQNG